MKRLALALWLGSMTPIALHAHCGVCGTEKNHDTADIKSQAIEAELKSMTEALSLDEAQQAKVKTALEKSYDQKVKAAKGKNEEMIKSQAQADKEIRKSLTKDQQAKLDELAKDKPACCPTPWMKCEKCCAMGSAKPCCPLAGQKGHQCPPKTKGATCPMSGQTKE